MKLKMKNIAINFEEATKETYNRWKNTPEQKNNAEKNIELAIVQALTQNYYAGFTRTNNARQKVVNIGKQGIIYSLLYNMVQLSSYKHQRINYSLGKPDPFITYIIEGVRHGNIADIENMLITGINHISNKSNMYDISDYDKVALEFAEATLTAYSWYNTAYHTVSATEEISNFYDKEVAKKLEEYYYNELKKETSPKRSI